MDVLLEKANNDPSSTQAERIEQSRSFFGRTVLKAVQTIFPDRQFVSLLRFELTLFVVTLYSKLSPVEWSKRRAIRNEKALKINVGNGPFRHEGWLNIDCRFSLKKHEIVCDLRRSWPLASECARYIFSEHVFEHFGYPDQITHVLSECHRILRPGGALRIIVPDAERYLRAYAENDQRFFEQAANGTRSKISVVNDMMRENGFHKYAYDYDELQLIIKSVGFSSVGRSSFRGSCHNELNLDLDDSMRDLVSLYIEAVK